MPQQMMYVSEKSLCRILRALSFSNCRRSSTSLRRTHPIKWHGTRFLHQLRAASGTLRRLLAIDGWFCWPRRPTRGQLRSSATGSIGVGQQIACDRYLSALLDFHGFLCIGSFKLTFQSSASSASLLKEQDMTREDDLHVFCTNWHVAMAPAG